MEEEKMEGTAARDKNNENLIDRKNNFGIVRDTKIGGNNENIESNYELEDGEVLDEDSPFSVDSFKSAAVINDTDFKRHKIKERNEPNHISFDKDHKKYEKNYIDKGTSSNRCRRRIKDSTKTCSHVKSKSKSHRDLSPHRKRHNSYKDRRKPLPNNTKHRVTNKRNISPIDRLLSVKDDRVSTNYHINKRSTLRYNDIFKGKSSLSNSTKHSNLKNNEVFENAWNKNNRTDCNSDGNTEYDSDSNTKLLEHLESNFTFEYNHGCSETIMEHVPHIMCVKHVPDTLYSEHISNYANIEKFIISPNKKTSKPIEKSNVEICDSKESVANTVHWCENRNTPQHMDISTKNCDYSIAHDFDGYTCKLCDKLTNEELVERIKQCCEQNSYPEELEYYAMIYLNRILFKNNSIKRKLTSKRNKLCFKKLKKISLQLIENTLLKKVDVLDQFIPKMNIHSNNENVNSFNESENVYVTHEQSNIELLTSDEPEYTNEEISPQIYNNFQDLKFYSTVENKYSTEEKYIKDYANIYGTEEIILPSEQMKDHHTVNRIILNNKEYQKNSEGFKEKVCKAKYRRNSVPNGIAMFNNRSIICNDVTMPIKVRYPYINMSLVDYSNSSKGIRFDNREKYSLVNKTMDTCSSVENFEIHKPNNLICQNENITTLKRKHSVDECILKELKEEYYNDIAWSRFNIGIGETVKSDNRINFTDSNKISNSNQFEKNLNEMNVRNGIRNKQNQIQKALPRYYETNIFLDDFTHNDSFPNINMEKQQFSHDSSTNINMEKQQLLFDSKSILQHEINPVDITSNSLDIDSFKELNTLKYSVREAIPNNNNRVVRNDYIKNIKSRKVLKLFENLVASDIRTRYRLHVSSHYRNRVYYNILKLLVPFLSADQNTMYPEQFKYIVLSVLKSNLSQNIIRGKNKRHIYHNNERNRNMFISIENTESELDANIKNKFPDENLQTSSSVLSTIMTQRMKTSNNIYSSNGSIQDDKSDKSSILKNVESYLLQTRSKLVNNVDELDTLLQNLTTEIKNKDITNKKLNALKSMVKKVQGDIQHIEKNITHKYFAVHNHYNIIMRRKNHCIELEKMCLNVGTNLFDSSYNVPVLNEEELRDKLAKITVDMQAASNLRETNVCRILAFIGMVYYFRKEFVIKMLRGNGVRALLCGFAISSSWYIVLERDLLSTIVS